MTRTSLEIGGRESRLEIPNLQPIAGCLWTLVDVYGRLWMAPRAGFEVRRKWLNGHLPAGSRWSRYPGDTPRPSALHFPSRAHRIAGLEIHQSLLPRRVGVFR